MAKACEMFFIMSLIFSSNFTFIMATWLGGSFRLNDQLSAAWVLFLFALPIESMASCLRLFEWYMWIRICLSFMMPLHCDAVIAKLVKDYDIYVSLLLRPLFFSWDLFVFSKTVDFGRHPCGQYLINGEKIAGDSSRDLFDVNSIGNCFYLLTQVVGATPCILVTQREVVLPCSV